MAGARFGSWLKGLLDIRTTVVMFLKALAKRQRFSMFNEPFRHNLHSG